MLKKTALAIALIVSSPSYSAGIPTIDVAAIAQMVKDGVEQVQRFKEQMDAVRSQIEEAKNQLNEAKRQGQFYEDMVNNYTDVFENALIIPDASDYLTHGSWDSIYDSQSNDINSLRNKYGLKSDDPKMQAYYDSLLQNHSLQEKQYESSVARQNRLVTLSQLFQSADTPAKKADLANSLEFEKIQLENERALAANMQALMQQQRNLETTLRVQTSKAKLLKKEWE